MTGTDDFWQHVLHDAYDLEQHKINVSYWTFS